MASRKNLLLVDPLLADRQALVDELIASGYEVKNASSAAEAQALVRGFPPDLVLSEVQLPGEMDGLALVEALKGQERFASLPVILFGRAPTIPQRVRGIELGVADFLEKPLYLKEVLGRIQVLLEKQALQLPASAPLQRHGSLADENLLRLIERLLQDQVSGLLELRGPDQTGQLWLRDGEVQDARVGPLRGERALNRLWLWRRGTFDLQPDAPMAPPAFELSTRNLLFEGKRRQQEWERLLPSLPGLDEILEVDDSKRDQRVSIIPDDLELVLALCDGERDVQRVIEDSGLDEVAALELLSRLYGNGMLRKPSAMDARAEPRRVPEPAPLPRARKLEVTTTPPQAQGADAVPHIDSAAQDTIIEPAPIFADNSSASMAPQEAPASVRAGLSVAPEPWPLGHQISQDTLIDDAPLASAIPTPAQPVEIERPVSRTAEVPQSFAPAGEEPAQNQVDAAPGQASFTNPVDAPALAAHAVRPNANDAPWFDAQASSAAPQTGQAAGMDATPPAPDAAEVSAARAHANAPVAQDGNEGAPGDVQPSPANEVAASRFARVQDQGAAPEPNEGNVGALVASENSPSDSLRDASEALSSAQARESEGFDEATASSGESERADAASPANDFKRHGQDNRSAADDVSAPSREARDAKERKREHEAEADAFLQQTMAQNSTPSHGSETSSQLPEDSVDDELIAHLNAGKRTTAIVIGLVLLGLLLAAWVAFLLQGNAGDEPATDAGIQSPLPASTPPTPPPADAAVPTEPAPTQEAQPPAAPTSSPAGTTSPASRKLRDKAAKTEAQAPRKEKKRKRAAEQAPVVSSEAKPAPPPEEKRNPKKEDEIYTQKLKEAENLSKQGDFRGAIAAYLVALEIRANSGEAHLGLGNAYYEINEVKNAIRHLEKAKSLLRKDPQVFVLLGAVYQTANRTQDAVAAYEQYLEMAPNGRYARDVRNLLIGIKGQ